LDQGISTPYSRGTFCQVIHADLGVIDVFPKFRTKRFRVSQGRQSAGDILHLIHSHPERCRNLGVRPIRIAQRQADQSIPGGEPVFAKQGEHSHGNVGGQL